MPRPSIAPFVAMIVFAATPLAAQAQTPGLPAGAGKALVEGVCTGCHQTSQIVRSSGYTHEGWRELIGTMIDLSGSPAEQDEIVRYLAERFPPNDRRAPTLVPGEVEITLQA